MTQPEVWFARPFWTPVHWKGWVLSFVGLPLILSPFLVTAAVLGALRYTSLVDDLAISTLEPWFAGGALLAAVIVVIGLNITARKHLR